MDHIFDESLQALGSDHEGIFDRPRFGSSLDVQEENDKYIVRAYLDATQPGAVQRVLVISEDPAFALALRGLFSEHGIDVRCEANPTEAVLAIRDFRPKSKLLGYFFDFLNAAHRLFWAATILARASGDMVRFFFPRLAGFAAGLASVEDSVAAPLLLAHLAR